jgi:hypothetical protein
MIRLGFGSGRRIIASLLVPMAPDYHRAACKQNSGLPIYLLNETGHCGEVASELSGTHVR